MKYCILVFISSLLACSPSKTLSSAKNQSAEFTVLSYNIHHCNPPSKPGLIDLDSVAGVIRKENPDLVALQEVDVNTGRSGKIDEAALLAEKTGMKYKFYKAIDHDGGDYGLAILSKFDLASTQLYPLPTDAESKGEPRILATAIVKINGKQVLFACTHLDAQRDSKNRLMQIRKIRELLDSQKLPVIIAGDLNADPESEVIKIFDESFKRTCTNCGYTIPVVTPNKTIDFIGYKPGSDFEVVNHQVVNEHYASDHLPIKAVLKMIK